MFETAFIIVAFLILATLIGAVWLVLYVARAEGHYRSQHPPARPFR